MKETTSLEQVLQYKNQNIINKFLEEYDLSEEEVKDIFEETKKWLWLCSISPKLYMDDSIVVIDKMWHTFILFTKDYNEFCLHYFDNFIHHEPSTTAQKEEFKENYEVSNETYKELLRNQFTFIYKELGEDHGKATLTKWYDIYSQKYTRGFLKSIKK